MFPNQSGLAPRKSFIAAMRQVAASVTVVTTDGQAGRRGAGATVSAFASVSADPLTILICLLAKSTYAKAIEENCVHCVKALPEYCADLVDRFAGHHDALVQDRFVDFHSELSRFFRREVSHL